ncbi:uncharacterized protein BO96DRAFT_470073 [Aspergillus niger CBS 101883]|uniref:Uncharacterized protein n=2 Tax=Aspergillus niger TaxID=5061 RepID=A2Q7Z4_ASPNC|nr:uncharacterized protein BO96DRAFT_470073 [Aspergillus niger CBS 101883]XP_059603118.1 hypothetical protein An01g02480 [Aspergillus niger]PYH51396.1 hypothetical protein BO96DRAFT_470073 [Aspergillus niger CBS 101883]CAK43617.1 hypothetical protein An01g02480 [Aspergillus niger]
MDLPSPIAARLDRIGVRPRYPGISWIAWSGAVSAYQLLLFLGAVEGWRIFLDTSIVIYICDGGMKDPISWAAAPVLSAQLGKGDKFINLAAAACRLMLVLLCVDVLTAGQRCFYGMVMELETFPSMGLTGRIWRIINWLSRSRATTTAAAADGTRRS